ncbi:MAG TPA: dihydroneopterin aldolase [Burkholderiaceae bacterium]
MTWLLDPRLARCRRIFLRDFALDASIGVHAAEKRGSQRLLVSVDVFVPLSRSTPRSDRIQEVVDYDFIRAAIERRIAQGHIHLQETLVDDLARGLLEHPDVVAVRITSEKTEVYPRVAGVGVEVLRFKEVADGSR